MSAFQEWVSDLDDDFDYGGDNHDGAGHNGDDLSVPGVYIVYLSIFFAGFLPGILSENQESIHCQVFYTGQYALYVFLMNYY